jgi:hypothetical protein
MQRRGSTFNGYSIQATDGYAGCVSDILFDDKTWIVWRFVVNAESWQAGRKILLHPAALERPDTMGQAFSVKLTKAQVEASPAIACDEPRWAGFDPDLDDGYDDRPLWGSSSYGLSAVSAPPNHWINRSGEIIHAVRADGDPHLRSMSEVAHYHIHALDGTIGHLADFLIDDESWKIDCALVDTKNWWVGKRVLLPMSTITEINWGERYLRVDLTRDKIKSYSSWTLPKE